MMKLNKLCKSIMSGMFFPVILMTFLYSMLWYWNISNIRNFPAQFMVMYIPLLFGLTNYIYLLIGDSCPIKNHDLRLWVFGGVLGFIVSIAGVFIFEIPRLLFNITGILTYLPLVLLPIIYGAIFRYIIKWVNEL